MRRARRRLYPLIRQHLIELPRAGPEDESWPWHLTDLGERTLAKHREENGETG